MRLDSLRRCKPDQVRGSAGDRTLSALDPHVDAEALPCRTAHDSRLWGRVVNSLSLPFSPLPSSGVCGKGGVGPSPHPGEGPTRTTRWPQRRWTRQRSRRGRSHLSNGGQRRSRE